MRVFSPPGGSSTRSLSVRKFLTPALSQPASLHRCHHNRLSHLQSQLLLLPHNSSLPLASPHSVAHHHLACLGLGSHQVVLHLEVPPQWEPLPLESHLLRHLEALLALVAMRPRHLGSLHSALEPALVRLALQDSPHLASLDSVRQVRLRRLDSLALQAKVS
jgi:hypothetical protein